MDRQLDVEVIEQHAQRDCGDEGVDERAAQQAQEAGLPAVPRVLGEHQAGHQVVQRHRHQDGHEEGGQRGNGEQALHHRGAHQHRVGAEGALDKGAAARGP
jgi:hypothetical protein